MLNNDFHSSVKINYKECKGYSNSNDHKSNYNKVKKIKKIKRKIKFFFGIPRDFYSCHLYSSSSFFNLCSSWNINGWNSKKRDDIIYLNSIFLNLYVYAFRKLVIVSSSLKGTLLLFLVTSLFSFMLILKSLEWEVYISVFIILVLILLKMPTIIRLYQLVWRHFEMVWSSFKCYLGNEKIVK